MENEFKLHPANKFCNDEVEKLLLARLAEESIESRLDVASMSQIFSFWAELQKLMQESSEEIKKLKQRIKELEK
jgi:hypothetical protein